MTHFVTRGSRACDAVATALNKGSPASHHLNITSSTTHHTFLTPLKRWDASKWIKDPRDGKRMAGKKEEITALAVEAA